MFVERTCLMVRFLTLRLVCITLTLNKIISKYEADCPKLLQYNFNGSNTDGSFTVDDSNSLFSPHKILPIAQENKYLGMFSYHGIVCCVYSLESPHWGDSNEYIQHTIIVWKI